MICITSANAFSYAKIANVNQGVIAGLFTSGVVFTAIVFYVLYQEKIGKTDLVGMITILTGVVCVGLKNTDSNVTDQTALFLAIGFALVTALLYTFSMVIGKYCVSVLYFTPVRLTIDGMFCAGLM
jgi:drug/metabolite transporter (DMT)-like permease